jgi:hypothetical protein
VGFRVACVQMEALRQRSGTQDATRLEELKQVSAQGSAVEVDTCSLVLLVCVTRMWAWG